MRKYPITIFVLLVIAMALLGGSAGSADSNETDGIPNYSCGQIPFVKRIHIDYADGPIGGDVDSDHALKRYLLHANPALVGGFRLVSATDTRAVYQLHSADGLVGQAVVRKLDGSWYTEDVEGCDSVLYQGGLK